MLREKQVYYKYTGTSPFGKVALERARSHGNNVTVIACIQSDLMSLLVITVGRLIDS